MTTLKIKPMKIKMLNSLALNAANSPNTTGYGNPDEINQVTEELVNFIRNDFDDHPTLPSHLTSK